MIDCKLRGTLGEAGIDGKIKEGLEWCAMIPIRDGLRRPIR